MWITNSAEAEIFLVSRLLPSPPSSLVLILTFPLHQVFANLDPSKGYKGITCFLVEKEMGVEIAKKEKKVRWSRVARGILSWTLTFSRYIARHPRFLHMYA
jgi:alkylation response protein AidB-like acyl-CoA dehydrogenase